jgi:hypothetical protein
VQDVQAIIEFSNDLSSWSSEPDRVLNISTTFQQKAIEQLKFRSAIPVHELNQEFVRLRFQPVAR